MAAKFIDYYQSLGLTRQASAEEIQRAYRKLAREFHPDVNKDPAAEAKFKEASEAYEVLKDPEKRARYDQLGANWKGGQEFRPPPGWGGAGRGGNGAAGRGRQVNPEDFAGFSDFFETIFGGGGGFSAQGGGGGARGGQRTPRPRAGEDHEAEITISLTDAINGGMRTISLAGDDGQPRSFEVRVPPGVTDGTAVRLGGQGAEGRNGGPAGDLLLRMRIAPDPRFKIDPPGGHDLATVLPVSPSEAALGAKVDVPTPDGAVRVTLPPGSQSGQRLRIRGHGLSKRSAERGDLYAEVRIAVPRELSAAEREAYEALARASEWNPRA